MPGIPFLSSVDGPIKLDHAGPTEALRIVGTDPAAVATLQVVSAGQAASFHSSAAGATTQHALTALLTATGGANNSAANLVSNNTENSAVFISGKETDRGTLKVAHAGPTQTAGQNLDANAAALSIDLLGANTAAQGIFVTSTASPGGTRGKLLTLRNGVGDLFVVRADGTVGLANVAAIPTPPAGMIGLAPIAGVLTVEDDTGYTTELTRPTWIPADNGFLAATYDPVVATASTVLTAGTVHFARLRVGSRVTVGNLCLYVLTAGVTLTAGQCFAALYAADRTLLGVTADQATAWQSVGTKLMPLVTPVAVNPGEYLVAFWANGTTPPQMTRALANASANVNLTAATARFGSANTGVTTTAPAPLAALATGSIGWWAAVAA